MPSLNDSVNWLQSFFGNLQSAASSAGASGQVIAANVTAQAPVAAQQAASDLANGLVKGIIDQTTVPIEIIVEDGANNVLGTFVVTINLSNAAFLYSTPQQVVQRTIVVQSTTVVI